MDTLKIGVSTNRRIIGELLNLNLAGWRAVGITIVAKPGKKGAKAGGTYEFNEKEYYVAKDKQDLIRLIDNGADMSKVVANKIKT